MNEDEKRDRPGRSSWALGLHAIGIVGVLIFSTASGGCDRNTPDLVTIIGVSPISCTITETNPSTLWTCSSTISGTTANFEPDTVFERIEGSLSLEGPAGTLLGESQGGGANGGFQVRVEMITGDCDGVTGQGDAAVAVIEDNGTSSTQHTDLTVVELGVTGC